ncbi:MAG TPA: ATP-binding protein [Caulobacteraceae bacterium]|nr:ATP-binding protein [Caulobacteraceae bacterium]
MGVLAGPRAALARKLSALARWVHPPPAAVTREALDKAVQAAALAESRLRAAIDALPEGVVFLDHEGRYILWNQRYAEIYHRSADLFEPGRRLAETLAIGVARGDYPDALGREEEWIAERLAKLANPGERHEQRLSDGRWILIEERRTADGGLIGLRVDITEMKQTAEELEHAVQLAKAANQAKTEFLSNMSHEIRTPLNGVVGLAHVLARTALDPQQTKLVNTIVDSASLLEELLSDILDLSRIESGRLALRSEPFSVDRLAKESAANFAAKAEEKGLTLTVNLAEDLPEHVMGDVVRVRQVLGNLLSNAVKFTAEGEVSLSVRRDERWLLFDVKDSGIGFEADQGERLFERFVQADGSITRRFGGSGLGLAICRELVEMMNGEISATGRPGKGATFHVAIPLIEVAAGDMSLDSATI